MLFPLGIKQEAEIYLRASITGLQCRQSYVDSFVLDASANLKQMNIETYPYESVVKAIVKWTEQAVLENDWDLCDEDGVAWFIGLYSKSYIASLASSDIEYCKLFKDCFIKYFENK